MIAPLAPRNRRESPVTPAGSHRQAGLKPYSRFVELASLAVSDEWRGSGVGREIVSQLLREHQGPIYLVCEDHLIGFFRDFDFNLIPTSEMLPGLESKLEWYIAQTGHINVMKRE